MRWIKGKTGLSNMICENSYSNFLIRHQQRDYDPIGSNNLLLTTEYVYNSLGQVYQEIQVGDVNDPNFDYVTAYTWDELGNPVLKVSPDDTEVSYGYNAWGLLTSEIADYGTGKINQTTLYGYGRLGRKVEVTGSADGNTLQTTFYIYARLGRVTNVLYPDGNEIEYVYNPAGKVIQRTDQRGIVTNYSYDGVYNQRSKTATVGGLVSSETFSYDGLGRVPTAVKTVGANTISETEFAYNDIGRITDTNETLFDGNTFELHYTYDQAGNLTFIDYPISAQDITIVPDWSGRIEHDVVRGFRILELCA